MLRIKEICKEKGITLQDLSKKLGINYNSVHSIMTGNPKIDTLQKIADVLGVQITDLFEQASDFKALIDYKGSLYRANSINELRSLILQFEIEE